MKMEKSTKNSVVMMMSYIIVVVLVFLPSTSFAGGGRALNNLQLYSSDGQVQVTLTVNPSLSDIFIERPQENQCIGKFCAPWSPCQAGCICVGPTGFGACV